MSLVRENQQRYLGSYRYFDRRQRKIPYEAPSLRLRDGNRVCLLQR